MRVLFLGKLLTWQPPLNAGCIFSSRSDTEHHRDKMLWFNQMRNEGKMMLIEACKIHVMNMINGVIIYAMPTVSCTGGHIRVMHDTIFQIMIHEHPASSWAVKRVMNTSHIEYEMIY